MKGFLRFFRYLLTGWFILFFCSYLKAQQPLPEFSVVDKGGGRIVISWKNPFANLTQLNVQRSYDSLKRFNSIFSAESPELPQNGYTDKVYPGTKVYYRIFYSQEGGTYAFTKALRPARDTGTLTSETDLRRDQVTEAIKNAVVQEPDRTFYVKFNDSVLTSLMNGEYTRFKDSIVARTKDTLLLLTNDTILLKRYDPPFIYHTSIYVYPNKDGYIVLDLPEALVKKYDFVVKEEDETPVLNIKHIRATYLMLDKADFYHGGWYKFELWENGQIKEKNKLFLAKDY